MNTLKLEGVEMAEKISYSGASTPGERTGRSFLLGMPCLPARPTLLPRDAFFGQNLTGQSNGVVGEPTSGVILNAAVTVSNTDHNPMVREFPIGDEGQFMALLMALGQSPIGVRAKAFQAGALTHIAVKAGPTATVPVAMASANRMVWQPKGENNSKRERIECVPEYQYVPCRMLRQKHDVISVISVEVGANKTMQLQRRLAQ